MALTTPVGETFETYTFGSEQATQGVLIIHDWWGLRDYNIQWAEQFAQLGFRALVIDLYEGRQPVDAKEAGECMRNVVQEVANRKLQTALQQLQAPQRKIAVLGWSFGGLQAQHAVLHNPEYVDAIVLFYCRIILNKQNATVLKGPVLAIFSETERSWPDKQTALEYAMTDAGKTLTCYSYEAEHGFANPQSPHYDSEITEETWQLTVDFLNQWLRY
ncbi:MAG: dienelactone hydrolase family protein [Acidobacteriota bacterium]|nr:dienelactone hydrolase family protein [Acidobacteriota bacterium]